MTKEYDKKSNTLSPKEQLAQKVQEPTQQLEELNLSLKQKKYLTAVDGRDELIDAMKDTKRLLEIESRTEWFLEGMTPVDPVKMKASAERYNKGIEEMRIEHNRAQRMNEYHLKNHGPTDF